jgi:hypothetical protein
VSGRVIFVYVKVKYVMTVGSSILAVSVLAVRVLAVSHGGSILAVSGGVLAVSHGGNCILSIDGLPFVVHGKMLSASFTPCKQSIIN